MISPHLLLYSNKGQTQAFHLSILCFTNILPKLFVSIDKNRVLVSWINQTLIKLIFPHRTPKLDLLSTEPTLACRIALFYYQKKKKRHFLNLAFFSLLKKSSFLPNFTDVCRSLYCNSLPHSLRVIFLNGIISFLCLDLFWLDNTMLYLLP